METERKRAPRRRYGFTPPKKGTGRERLKQLQSQYDAMLARLYANPSDEALSRQVRHIEIDIVRLTGEKTIDY